MASFTSFGNDLYTGRRSIDFIRRRRIWWLVSGVIIVICIVGAILRGGFVFGIEFRGGNEFQVPGAASTDLGLATRAVDGVSADADPVATTIGAGNDTIRVQTETLSQSDTNAARDALAKAYDVPSDRISASIVGPSWGADITEQAIRALIVFLVLVTIVMALYFRTWKMSVAALISLLHDLVITAGVYAIAGFEVTPAAVIGFLTILGYSLYDTVVVFDKVRENTRRDAEGSRRTFAESVNLAVNQTLVRSINTSVVAVLPVASILFIGAFVLGAGTLRDIALALFVGIIVGTYSSIFIAAPLYVQFRQNEPTIRKQNARKAAGSTTAVAAAASGS